MANREKLCDKVNTEMQEYRTNLLKHDKEYILKHASEYATMQNFREGIVNDYYRLDDDDILKLLSIPNLLTYLCDEHCDNEALWDAEMSTVCWVIKSYHEEQNNEEE